MVPIQQFSSGVLAEIVRRQQPSKERTAFAWQIAVGPAVARITTVEVDAIDAGILRVTARDAHWAREIECAAATILARMQHLLGAQTIRSLKVVAAR